MDNELGVEVKSDDVNDIITKVPSWILRWGITLVFAILLSIIVLSAFIDYPDVVSVDLKVNSLNSPKSVLAKRDGKIQNLLVSEGEMVNVGTPLAYFEATALPGDMFYIISQLKLAKGNLIRNKFDIQDFPQNLELGEIQASYQEFYQKFLTYKSTLKNGYFFKRIAFLETELKYIGARNVQINKQKDIQRLEYKNHEDEYNAYKKLYQSKVISKSEFTQQENKYLASKYPLEQSETAILGNSSERSAKENELLDLRHTMLQEQATFVQAINRLINECEDWIHQYVLVAPMSGRITFAGIVQENQNVELGQEIFIVNPGNNNFFGEIHIPQYNMGKIRIGDETLIKLRSFPYEQFGIIKGKLSFISDVPYRDSVFIGKVNFKVLKNQNPRRRIVLKNGMRAEAEIITEKSTLLQRFYRNFIKILNER